MSVAVAQLDGFIWFVPVLLFLAWRFAVNVRSNRSERRSLRRWDGLCPECGYDLRASVGRCPECGHIEESRFPQRPSWLDEVPPLLPADLALGLDRIILRGGLGQLRFGMSSEEVIGLIGKPDDGDDETPRGTLTEMSWSYSRLRLDLAFRQVPDRGFRLIELKSEHPQMKLCGIELLGGVPTEALAKIGVHLRSSHCFNNLTCYWFDHGLEIEGFDGQRVIWDMLDDDDQIITAADQRG